MRLGGGNEQVVASTFRLGLPKVSELGDSLTMLSPEDVHQLMKRIEKYKILDQKRVLIPISQGVSP